MQALDFGSLTAKERHDRSRVERLIDLFNRAFCACDGDVGLEHVKRPCPRPAQEISVMRDHSVDDPVLARFVRCHEVVALHVLRDPFERLPGVVGAGASL
jgi:hypothetical protein